MPLNLPPPKASGSGVPSSHVNGASSDLNGSNGNTRPVEQETLAAAAGPSTSLASTGYSSSFSSKLGLPPPKTKSKLAASNQPKKFVLDLPKATRSASELDGEDGASSEPSTKKARTGSGLSALLPEPKKSTSLGGLKLPDPKTAGGVQLSSIPSTGLVPHVLKGKSKAVEKPEQATESSSKPETVEPAPSEEEIQDGEADSAVLDFFGLGPAAADDDDEDEAAETDAATMDFFGLSTAKTSGEKTTPKPVSATTTHISSAGPSAGPSVSLSSTIKKVSAAPTTAAPELSSNYYATLPVPTKTDPYPGFYQKPDGTWAPKRPDEWEIWSKAQGWGEDAEAEAAEQAKKEKEYKMPADFSAAAAEQSVEVRAANLRGKAAADEPAKLSRYTEEEQKKMEEDKMRAKAKKFSHNARSRHQLTTLVAEAQSNRQELEDRISQMKANKRTGGQKYGF